MFSGKTSQVDLVTNKKACYLKGWHAFFLLLVLSVFLSAGASAADREYPSRLWKIEALSKADSKPSYLLGTMHLADKEIVQLPPHIASIVDSASSLALEVKLDGESQKALSKLTALEGSQTLSDIIGLSQFKQIALLLKSRGINEYSLQRLKPWAAGLILNYPPVSLDPVLDYSLQLKFSRKNKPIYQLETAKEQIEIFDKLTVS